MKVNEIMTKEVEILHLENSWKEAAQKMRVRNIGYLPVFDGDSLVGVLTDRDIALRSTAEGTNPNTSIGREWITSPVVYCFDDQDVEEAAQLMEDHQIRRVAVLSRDDNRLVGVVSLGDIAMNGTKETSAEVLEKVSEPTS